MLHVSFPQKRQAGNTPLHLAASSASPTAPAAVAALLSEGADACARNAARATPLMAHVRAAPRTPASTDVASLLLASGADVNAPDSVRACALRSDACLTVLTRAYFCRPAIRR